MKGIIYWFARNHVAANFIMVIILLLGITTWGQIKKEIFPETAIDAVAISVPYPNAAPEEVEKGVILPIEEAIEDLDGIERITSVAARNIGTVTVECVSGYPVRNLMDDLKTRIDAIDSFAEEAEEPLLEELLIKANVLSVAVTAETDEATHRRLAERVRDELLLLDDLSQVSLGGTRPYEVSIEVSENTLRELGLTFDQVANAVRASSLDLPGGSIRTESGEFLIRTQAKRYTADEFADVTVVTRPDGSRVLLGDIATIIDGFEEVDLQNTFDGRPAILVNVFRTGDQDTLDVADAVKKFVCEEAPLMLPEGVGLEIWRDDSLFLKGRMDLLRKNGFFGLILVFFVLALFLRPSLAFLVTIGIPVSFAGAIMVMPFTGISINMISLFAFILVLGIVVDDAIVVSESVFQRLRAGEDPKIAAPAGTHEVGVVVIFGVLTTVVAFTPMLGLPGVSGRIWPNIPWIVIPTLLFSIVQSKFVLPAHLSFLRASDATREEGTIIRFQQHFSHGLEKFIDAFYRPLLRWTLHNRYLALSGFVAILILISTVALSGWLKFEFFPQVEADVVTTKIEMPAGVPFETTKAAVAQIDAAAIALGKDPRFALPDGKSIIKHRLATSGAQPFLVDPMSKSGPSAAAHIGEVTIELRPSVERPGITAVELASAWRELCGPIPGAVELSFQSQAAGGGNAIDLEIAGPDIERLEIASAMIKDALAEYHGVIDIADSNRRGNREIKLNILPGGEALGLRLQDVARQTRQGFYGEEVQRLQRGRDEVKIMVRYPRNERETIDNLENIKIRTMDGSEIPFADVATGNYGRSYASIQRADRRRAITVTADIDKAIEGVNAKEVVSGLLHEPTPPTALKVRLNAIENWFRNLFGWEAKVLEQKEEGVFVALKKLYPEITLNFQGEQKDQAQSVKEIGQGMLIALAFIYILMAIPLRSYIQPLIIMSAIPFGIVGAIIGHMIMGWMELSIMSMCGIVALAGVVVNDSLVLVDYVNRHRNDGGSLIDAVWEAGAKRFRPILLTSLTTFASLTPMLLETDMQAKFLIPMAVSLSFGILFATFITLLLVPCIYLILEDLGRLGRKVFLKAESATEPAR